MKCVSMTFMTVMMLLLSAKGMTQQGEKIFDVKKFGATGNGKTDDAAAIQEAIDACEAAGGGTVEFPAPAVYMAGPLDIKSNVDMHLQSGATLLANPDEKLYTKSAFRSNRSEGTMWISGENIENFSITGSGAIDGNGISFMGKELGDSYALKPFKDVDPRPHLLTIIKGKNIRMRDIHIGNSAYWTVHLAGCSDVVIDGITLQNSVKVRNSDGIDIDHSRNVRICNCHIESGDDCICLKNRREYGDLGVCENVTVTNCVMTSRSCAIKIGSENMDTIRDVVFDNCIIRNSNRGVGIQNRDEGVVSDIMFSNMLIEGRLFSDVWWGKAEPIYITAYRRAKANNKDANLRFPAGAKEGRVGKVSNIYFSNIKCVSENGVYVSAESKDKISNIFFDNVDVSVNKTTAFPGGLYDRRPANVEGFVTGKTAGFYFDTVENITLRNCSVRWGDNKMPYFKEALYQNHVTGLVESGVAGQDANPD